MDSYTSFRPKVSHRAERLTKILTLHPERQIKLVDIQDFYTFGNWINLVV